VTPTDYDFLRKYFKDRSGLILTVDKNYLIESRLGPIARKRGYAQLSEMVAKLKLGSDPELEKVAVEAMTTNESFFFRDKTPFDLFKESMLPSLLKTRADTKRIRIWCAAASTGQEPYSLAMTIREMSATLAGWKFEILGTDLSTEVLDRAKAGIYSQFEVQRGLPIQMLMKYFNQIGEQWQIKEDIKSMVQYRPLNLLRDFSSLGQFDIVFCRNVLIYFDQPTKGDILGRVRKMLTPDGFMVLGAAETVVGITNVFKPHSEKRGLYIPNAEAENSQKPRFALMG
jgi:chemotaxis protein methyltransferase CheR